MKKKIKKLKKIKSREKNYLLKILICLVFGSIVGAYLANNISDDYMLSIIYKSIKDFFVKQENNDFISNTDLFISEFFKHTKIILFIWLMAFAPISQFFIGLILFFRGICYGFVMSILFFIYRLDSIWQIIKYILPMNFIFLLIIIFISDNSLKYASESHKKNTCQYIFKGIMSFLFIFLVLLCQKYIFLL